MRSKIGKENQKAIIDLEVIMGNWCLVPPRHSEESIYKMHLKTAQLRLEKRSIYPMTLSHIKTHLAP